MTIKPFFPVFIVLVGVVIYAYHAPPEKPERATHLSPKEYIEMVEQKKSERERENEMQEEPTGAESTPPAD